MLSLRFSTWIAWFRWDSIDVYSPKRAHIYININTQCSHADKEQIFGVSFCFVSLQCRAMWRMKESKRHAYTHMHTVCENICVSRVWACVLISHMQSGRSSFVCIVRIFCVRRTQFIYFCSFFFSPFSFHIYSVVCSSSFSRWLFIAFKVAALLLCSVWFCFVFFHSLVRQILLWWGGCLAGIVISQESKLRCDCICACL